MEDFNNILNVEERMGSRVTSAEIRDLKQCMESCNLLDLKYSGAYFTWTNKQQGEARVVSKINRVLVNHKWHTKLPASEARFLTEGLSDHCPTIVQWEEGTYHQKTRFKYYNM